MTFSKHTRVQLSAVGKGALNLTLACKLSCLISPRRLDADMLVLWSITLCDCLCVPLCERTLVTLQEKLVLCRSVMPEIIEGSTTSAIHVLYEAR